MTCSGSHSWFLSLASLSRSARFPASWVGDVSSLFKSGGFLCPCLPVGGQTGGGGGSRWGTVPHTYLPLKSLTCLFSCLCSNVWELGGFLKKGWSGLLTMVDSDVLCLCFEECLCSSGLSFLPRFGLCQNAQQGRVQCKWWKSGKFTSNWKWGCKVECVTLGGFSGHPYRILYVCMHVRGARRLCRSTHISYFKILIF